MTTEPAPTAPVPAAEAPAVIRSVGRCFLLLLVSFGLWSIAWIYHTTKDVSPKVTDKSSPGLRAFGWIIPIVNYVVLYLTWRDVEHFTKKAGTKDFALALYFILTILIPFVAIFTYWSVQNKMNAAWEAETGGTAVHAPMEAIDWVTVVLGLLGVGTFVAVVAGN
jgi:hypothetical protein